MVLLFGKYLDVNFKLTLIYGMLGFAACTEGPQQAAKFF